MVAVDGRLRLGPDGRLLLLRPPLPGEADRLRRLAGLPVPELVDEVEGELLVTWAPPLATPLADAVPFVAGVLADAHDLGVCHGPLEADHVRTGVLDGWAGGDPTDDVAAFGRLVLGADPPPALAALARRCIAADPATRPTMRAVASSLSAPPTPGCADDPPPPSREIVRNAARRPLPAWVPAAVAVPVAVAAVVLASGGPPAPEPRAVPSATPTTTSTPPTTFGAAPYEGVDAAEPYEGVSPP